MSISASGDRFAAFRHSSYTRFFFSRLFSAFAIQIISVAVGKGKDYAFQGAIDGLRVNDTVFDFESGGVFSTTP